MQVKMPNIQFLDVFYDHQLPSVARLWWRRLCGGPWRLAGWVDPETRCSPANTRRGLSCHSVQAQPFNMSKKKHAWMMAMEREREMNTYSQICMYINVYMYVYTYNMGIYIYVCMYAYIYICIDVCIYTYMYTHWDTVHSYAQR